jgi:hypothetical protein
VWLLAFAATAALAGCGSTASSGPRRHTASTPQLHIGESATLEGHRPGERVRVTLVAFTPGFTGGANEHPEFNMQYAGAELRLTNVGSIAYTRAPADSVTVATNEGQKSTRAELTEGPCSEAFARQVDLAPGESAQGCVPVQVSVVATATTLTFAVGREGSHHAAVWSLAIVRKTRRSS